MERMGEEGKMMSQEIAYSISKLFFLQVLQTWKAVFYIV